MSFLCLVHSKSLSSSLIPAPRRRASPEEKGAGGLFQNERVRRICEPEFSQQALQVCALPRRFQHIGGKITRSPSHLQPDTANPPQMSADEGSALFVLL